ncbi:NifU family protein [Marispirochaeta aestuarii]|uniref:NifU family protein n=1 Tax=Marispirochaeta aestuarii TaxID=1963862 RepID=UPI0029C8A385|nr:NifU family protein [Marispirochaeta aestuarii]
MREEVIKAIQDVRPSLQADGGDIEFVDVSDSGQVTVRLMGACNGCPMAQMTLKQGVEQYLKEKVPGVVSVDSV